MMGKRDTAERHQIKLTSIDDMVPKNHLIRKIDKAIDLSFIYDKVENLYKPYGRESVDPVVLIKIVMIQYIFGIRSMRQTIKEIEVNIAYRWFLGYGLNEDIPHFSTFGKNYSRRFEGTSLFEDIFKAIIEEAIKYNFIDEENIFIDGTHIKANANNHKYKKDVVKKSAKFYEEELKKEIDEDRKKHGKKPLKDTESIETKTIKVSTTDPQCGVFHKGEHKKVFAYTSNTACDINNYILDFNVTSGNTHDSVAFPSLYTNIIEQYKNVKNIVVDSGYKTPAIAKLIIDSNKVPIMPYKRPMTKKDFFKKYEFVYDEYYDCVICPNNQILKYSTTNRDGYREYKSNNKICKKCPFLKKCTESKNNTKVVGIHIWQYYIDKVEDIRHTNGSKDIYSKRSETIERVFADAKELHGMRYTQYRGLAKIKMELTLLFACMNLKKLAIWKSRKGLRPK
ncbi:IS1182 family transposase, partial [Clostridium sporogenes]